MKLPLAAMQYRPSGAGKARLALATLLAAGLVLPMAAWAVIDVNKNFNPVNVSPGQNTILTIDLLNSVTTAATGVALTDVLPDANGGLDEVVATSIISNSCGGTLTLTTAPAQIVLTGGTIPASADGIQPGRCQIMVNANSSLLGTHVNTIPVGGVTSTNQGSNPQLAQATLTNTGGFAAPTVAKTASAAFVKGGSTVNYTVTITNPNAATLLNTSFSDSLPATLVIANPVPVANTCGGSVTDSSNAALVNGSTSFRLSGGSVPGGTPSGSCAVTFTVRPASDNTVLNANATNTIAAGAITTAQGVSNAAASSVAVSVQTGGNITKSFAPTTVRADGIQTSTLTLQLRNRNISAITPAALTDTLPAGIVVAPTPGITATNCGAASVTAAAGGGSIAIANATIPAATNASGSFGVCTITANVVVPPNSTGGTNSIGAGNFGAGLPSYAAVNATLTGTNPISGAKVFAPASTSVGTVSTLTITLNNASTAAANISNFTDNFAATLGSGFVVATPANAGNTCGGSFAPAAGASTLSKTDGAIPAGGSCTLSVDVMVQATASAGAHTNTAAVTTNLGSNNALTGNITVVNPITGSKAFNPSPRRPGGISSLTITLNNAAASPASISNFTDNLSATLGAGFAVASPANASTTCGGSFAPAPGDTTLAKTDGAIPAVGSCTIKVDVAVPAAATLGSHTNTASVTTSLGSNAAITGSLVVANPISGTKAFSPATVGPGAVTTMTVTLNNSDSNTPANISGFTDDFAATLGAGFVVASPANGATTCGGSFTPASGASSISKTDGVIPANGSCTITVSIQVPAGASLAAHTNTAAVVTDIGSNNAVNGTLNVANPINGSKVFAPNTIQPGGKSSVTITLTNTAAQASAITSFTDNLTATMGAGFVVANPANASTTCGGSFAPNPGDSTLSKNDGAIPAGGNCNIKFDVQVPAGAALAVYTNSATANTSLGNRTVNGNLTVANVISGSKAFSPTSVPVGSVSTLTVTLNNSSAAVATATSFTDSLLSMDAAGNVVVATAPAASTTCAGGAVTALAGSTSFSLAGGAIPANGSCTVTVPVVGKKGVPLVSLTNIIAAGGISTSLGGNTNAISANLGFTTPHTVSKVFAPATLPRGGSSTLTITLNNSSGSAATINSFVDDLNSMDPVGGTPDTVLIAAGATTNCTGSALTATPGTQLISLAAGGTIPAGGNCTITVPVTVQPSAPLSTRTNSIAANALDTSLGNNIVAATGTLTPTTAVTLAKSFLPASFNGNQAAVSRLTITVTHANLAPAFTGMALTDDLGSMGAGHVVATPANAQTTCGGTLSAVSGASSFSLAGGNLPAGATSCTIAVDVQTPANVANGDTRTNTLPIGALSTDQGLSNTAAATATISRAKAPDLQVLNKNFVPSIINGGGNSVLSLSFINTLPGAQNLTNVTVTDNFPAGMQLGSPLNFSFTGSGCSGGRLIGNPGDSSFTLAGASIAVNANCTMNVNATAFVDGNLTNAIPVGSVSSDQGASNSNLVQKTLTVTRSVNVLKYFSPNAIEAGGVSSLVLRIFNSNTVTRTGCSEPATGACVGVAQNYFFRDNLPAGVTVAGGSIGNTCPGSFLSDASGAPGSLGAGDTVVQLNGGTYAVKSFCDLTIPVTGLATGTYVNTIPVGALQTVEASSNPDPSSDTLTIIAKPTIAKAFGPTSIAVGGSSTISFTLSNPNTTALLPGGLTGVSFSDALVNMSIATPGAAGGTCSGASGNLFSAGQTALNFSNITIPSGPGSCTVTVVVTSNVAGVQPNTTSGLLSNQTQTPGAPSNTANLNVLLPPGISKLFNPKPLVVNGVASLTFTLSNANNVALAIATPGFTDVFPTSPGPMTLANTTTSTTCTGATILDSAGGALNAGDIGIRVNGGSIPANSSCTVTVNVTASIAGSYNNLSGPLATTNAGSSSAGASDTLVVNNGNPLSGYVYRDANINGSREGGEDWTAGTPVFINLVQGGVVVQSTTVNPGTGFYTFPGVVAGSYTLVLSNSATSITPQAPAGFTLVTPADGRISATVGSSPALLYNFGLIDSAGLISGKVFRDTGPTANDGIAQGAEVGITGVSLTLSNCAGTSYASTTTDGSGNYQFYVPAGLASGAPLCVEENNPAGLVSTGASIASTAAPSGTAVTVAGVTYTYSRSTAERIAFNLSTGVSSYSGLNFGEVPPNVFTTDNVQTTLAGTTVYHAHRYLAGSAGTVSFSSAALATPNVPGWAETFFLDANCNGLLDTGDTPITAPVALAAGQEICILVREFVPANAPNGGQNNATITASFSYSNATPALTSVLTHTDITIVGQANGAGLRLTKAVDLPQAAPGTLLTYTLSYTNTSSETLSSIVVNDATPAYTFYVGGSAQCLLPLPANLSACSVSLQPANGATGALTWTLSGSLASGATGQVSYKVMVQN